MIVGEDTPIEATLKGIHRQFTRVSSTDARLVERNSISLIT